MEEINGISRFRFELNELMEIEEANSNGKLEILKMIAQQWSYFIPKMEEMAKDDLQLNAKMMNPDLSFIDLCGFLSKKALEFCMPGINTRGKMAYMADQTVLNWIRDYYDHEGVAALRERREKEKKAAEQAEKAKQKMAEKAAGTSSGKKEIAPSSDTTALESSSSKKITAADNVTDVVNKKAEGTDMSPSVLAATREKPQEVKQAEKTEQKREATEVYHQMSLFDFL